MPTLHLVDLFYWLKDGQTTPVSAEDPLPTRTQSESLVKDTFTATGATLDQAVHTPESGKAIRLYFFGYSCGAGVDGVLAQLKLGGYNDGNPFDAQYLVAAGQPYARNIQGGKRFIQGGADGALSIVRSADQLVHVNYELEEVDP